MGRQEEAVDMEAEAMAVLPREGRRKRHLDKVLVRAAAAVVAAAAGTIRDPQWEGRRWDVTTVTVVGLHDRLGSRIPELIYMWNSKQR
jgi:hypothetical protein